MNRQKMIAMRLISTGIMTLCLAMTPLAGEGAEPLNPWENKFTLGLGTDYATGRYGTHTSTDTVSVPVTLEWRPHTRLDIQLSLPYLYQSNSVNPAFKKGGSGVAGSSVTSGNQGSMAANGSSGTQGTVGGSGSQGAKLGQNSAQNGLGDLTLQLGIALLEEGTALPQLRLLGYCKFPTADHSSWLGSGEFDEGVGLSLAKSYGELQLYLEGLWIFQGGSDFLVQSGITVKDYLNYSAEIGYQATETLVPALALKGTSPTSAERGGTVEGDLKLSWKMTTHISLQGYVGTGFNTATADLTAGGSLFYNF